MPWWSTAAGKAKPISTPQLYNLSTDVGEKVDVAAQYPEKVSEMMALADQTRLKLGEYMERGSEQRPTGTLFPDVPILSNHNTEWAKLSDEEKGRAKTEFKVAHSPEKKKK
jgi:hypothetical protein